MIIWVSALQYGPHSLVVKTSTQPHWLNMTCNKIFSFKPGWDIFLTADIVLIALWLKPKRWSLQGEHLSTSTWRWGGSGDTSSFSDLSVAFWFTAAIWCQNLMTNQFALKRRLTISSGDSQHGNSHLRVENVKKTGDNELKSCYNQADVNFLNSPSAASLMFRATRRKAAMFVVFICLFDTSAT